MQEKIKGILDKVRQWWKAAAKKTKVLIGAGAVAVLAVILIVVAVSLNRPYTTLFTGLTQTDLSSIVSYLSDNGVSNYRIEGSDTILVPEDQEAQLKSELLLQGYPSSGFGYSSTYFDNVSSLTTESERTHLALLDLQERLASVIRYFPYVQDATVQITPGEDRTYILDSGNMVDATASVMVVMEEGRMLTDGQVAAIRNLVSNAVQGLAIDNVSIDDTYGNNYSNTDDFADIQDVSELKQRLEEQTDNKIRTQVMQALIPFFGEGNVRVSVNSVVDVDRTYTDSTNYSGEADDGEGIIGSTIYDRELIRGDDGAVGGVVGTESNADLNTYVEEQLNADGTETLISSSGQDDYLVDTENRQVEHLAGTVVDVMVAVTINQSAAGQVSVNDLYPHVARASGIGRDLQDEKISILVAPFYQEGVAPLPAPETLPAWVLIAALAGLGLFLILLIIFLLLRRRARKRRKAALEAQEAEQAEALATAAAAVQVAAPEGADIMTMQTEKSMELRKEVRKFAEENPEIAAQMVKSWLKEGDEMG